MEAEVSSLKDLSLDDRSCEDCFKFYFDIRYFLQEFINIIN